MYKLLKIFISILITFCLLNGIHAQSNSLPKKAWVWVTNLNTREKPDKNSKKAGQLDIGDIVSITEISNKKEKIGKVSDYWKKINNSFGEESWVFVGFIWEINKSNLDKIYDRIIEKKLYGINKINSSNSISLNDIKGKSFKYSKITYKCGSSGYSTDHHYKFLDSKNFKMTQKSDKYENGSDTIEVKGTYTINNNSIY